jgi:hypothetical protein
MTSHLALSSRAWRIALLMKMSSQMIDDRVLQLDHRPIAEHAKRQLTWFCVATLRVY